MFDTSLGWQFVSQNTQSAGQLLAYVPTILQAALGLTPDQVKTFALQVWEPSTYTGPQDAAQLRTVYIGYIPVAQVDILAQQIKALQSPFYTATTGIPASIAAHVDASFAVDAVANPISSTGSDNGSSTGDATTNSASGSSNARLDAIIGVCSALGGITLLIIAWLAYRNYKQRQELAHRRLSDPPPMDQSPAPGQDFDRDSVGGNRRRSFYFAEDSLRGYAEQPAPQDDRGVGASSGMMRERRPIVPGTISTPILRDNTLNW
ncbi:hypothetical protein SCHPADRAFT_837340 [Schizopora paradoxa]|uniref:Uncharacterized protein n=1 Tax=Schizopora paradoxa TaxID=27342 RepID=A0A0H2R5A3_9AGAM|nr:hypothetical protein SCHPADRAFT_837340 [Schizopora paradoxa]